MDSIGNMFTTIRNAIFLKKDIVTVLYSKEKEAIVKILKNKGSIMDYNIIELGNNKKEIQIKLKYFLNSSKKTSAISSIRRISKPSLRITSGYKKMPNLYGFFIVSTNKGIMSSDDAKKMKIGGEILGHVW